MFRSALVIVAGLTLVTTGCGSTGGSNNNNGGGDVQPDMTAPGPDLAPYDPGPYPEGPYGIKEGDTIYNVAPNGYALSIENSDVSTLEFKSLPLSSIRADPRCKCLMISKSARWCGPCNVEQDEFAKAHEEDPSFCIYNVLIQGLQNDGSRATPADVLAWVQQHNQNFPVVMGTLATDAKIPSYYSAPGITSLPSNILVNPKTMKILQISAGLGPNTIADAKAMCAADQ